MLENFSNKNQKSDKIPTELLPLTMRFVIYIYIYNVRMLEIFIYIRGYLFIPPSQVSYIFFPTFLTFQQKPYNLTESRAISVRKFVRFSKC